MRLFIAVQLSRAMRDSLCAAQEAFRRGSVRGNYTKPENLHLTLAFIGEYADPERVLEALESVPMQPFELRLDGGVGAFGDLWWAGLERCDALTAYVKSLRHTLADAGIPFDRKRFSPHITLIRRAACDRPGMPPVAVPKAHARVERASLMRSDRGKDGMIYTEIG